jgi:hypothetical protein
MGTAQKNLDMVQYAGLNETTIQKHVWDGKLAKYNKMWSFPLEITSIGITCLCNTDLVMFSQKSAKFTCFVLMELFQLVGLDDAS